MGRNNKKNKKVKAPRGGKKKVVVESEPEDGNEGPNVPDFFGPVNEEGIPLFLLGEAESKRVDIIIEPFSMTTPTGIPLINNCELRIVQGHRYGMIGRNGVGKSTLLDQMVNKTIPGWPQQLDVYMVKQEVNVGEKSVLEHVMDSDLARIRLMEFEEKLLDLMDEEAAPENADEILEIVYEVRDDMKVWTAEGRAQEILDGLQFTKEMQKMKTQHLSGGWRMRVALACALYREPDILLLDEPTNHLDFPAVIWLEKYLKTYPRSFILVTHDRHFLNETITHMIEFKDMTLTYTKGDFETWTNTKTDAERKHASDYDAQQKQIAHIKKFVERFRDDENQSSLVQSRLKELKKMALIEKPVAEKELHFKFPIPEKMKNDVALCRVQGVSFDYDAKKPLDKCLLRDVELFVDLDSRIGVLGANGCGKSTLIKLLMKEIQPIEGKIVMNEYSRVACFTQHHVDLLDMNMTAVEILQDRFTGDDLTVQVARNHLGSFGLGGNLPLQKIGTLSGGQKSRVSLAILTWTQPHILIMDEPTNHLDMSTIDSLLEAVNKFEGAVLIISHDQYFLNHFAKEFWAVASNGKVDVLYDIEAAKDHSYLIPEEEAEADSGPKKLTKKQQRKQQAKLDRQGKGQTNASTLRANLKSVKNSAR